MIPDEVLESDIAAIAQKGAGKTYLMKGLVERNLHAGRRTVIVDPLGVWWGLKVLASGKPGFPIPVVGGRHADVPLDPHKGEALAHYIAASSGSIVLDVSDLRRGELIRFCTDLFRELYRKNENALWLVLEEADVLAPQNPMGDATFLLHEVDQIARRGRNFGFRLWTITQRPARLNKDVLSMASALVLLRIRGPQDRDAVKEWVKGNAAKAEVAEVIDTLAALPVGEGWVYAPDVGLLERQHFPPIETLDNSATPKAGEVRGAIGELAKPDLGQLLAAMTPAEPEIALVIKAETLEAARKHGHKEGYLAGLAKGRTEGEIKGRAAILSSLSAWITNAFEDMRTGEGEAPDGRPAGSPPGNQKASTARAEADERPGDHRPAPQRPEADEPPQAKASAVSPDRGGAVDVIEPLPEAAQGLCAAARGAWRQVSWNEACVLAGLRPGGGYYNTLRAKLNAHGFAKPPEPNGEAGLLPSKELVGGWAKKLPPPLNKVLWLAYDTGPITPVDVAEHLGIARGGGYWNTIWKRVRANVAFHPMADGKRWDIHPILRELKERETT